MTIDIGEGADLPWGVANVAPLSSIDRALAARANTPGEKQRCRVLPNTEDSPRFAAVDATTMPAVTTPSAPLQGQAGLGEAARSAAVSGPETLPAWLDPSDSGGASTTDDRSPRPLLDADSLAAFVTAAKACARSNSLALFDCDEGAEEA